MLQRRVGMLVAGTPLSADGIGGGSTVLRRRGILSIFWKGTRWLLPRRTWGTFGTAWS